MTKSGRMEAARSVPADLCQWAVFWEGVYDMPDFSAAAGTGFFEVLLKEHA